MASASETMRVYDNENQPSGRLVFVNVIVNVNVQRSCYCHPLIIYGNLRAIYANLCFNKIHHRGAFLNMNDHKPLGRWPTREKQ